MGDPISAAANIAGLLSLGLQSIEYLYKFYTAYRNQDHDLAKIADKLDDLRGSLQIIDDVVRTRKWRPDEDTIRQHIETSVTRCKDIINELRDEAKKFEQSPPTNLKKTIVGAGRRVAYPFRRSTLEKLNEDVDDLRDNLSLALQALDLKEHQSVSSDLEEVKYIVKSVQAQHISDSVRQWLQVPGTAVDYNTAQSKHCNGTGQWLVQGSSFNDWLEQANSFLWLYGFAGCGKSVLCSTAIRHVFRYRQSLTDSVVGFFFFTFNDESKQDVSAALRTLLLQICGQLPEIEADLILLKESCNQRLPPVPTLLEHLRQAIMRCHDVYIFLDALDEIPTDSSRAETLAVIETMRQWQLSSLHLLVTSRDIPGVRDYLQPHTLSMGGGSIALKNDSVEQDIARYVSVQFENDLQLQRWGDQREKIKNYLTQHAGGLFRWVECQLQPLRQCPRSDKRLDKCLRALPRTLDETYERILCDIELQEEAQQALSLLCYASRPLSVNEVVEALAVNIEDECYDPKSRFTDGAGDLLRICPGLIEISRQTDDDSKKVDSSLIDFVRIAHFSIQEYLLSDRIRTSRARNFALSRTLQHAQISKLCLLYLCHADFVQQPLSVELIEKHAFAKYAAKYWYHHYQQASDQLVERTSESVIVLLTTPQTLERWIRLHNPDRPWDMNVNYHKNFKDLPSPIYFSSLLGLSKVLAHLISTSLGNINAQGGRYGTALQAASLKGHEKIVQMLLDKGVNVNAYGGRHGSALQAAAFNGHEKIVQMLLDQGASIDAQGGRYGTALQAASYFGYKNIVKLLIDNNADINTKGGYYGSALQAASFKNYAEVVQTLLDESADVNVQGGRYGTALHAASSEGHERIVQVLLSKGPDIDCQEKYHGTALQAASYNGHKNIVQILIDHKADVNAQGGYYGFALQAASYNGWKKVVQVLLDAGADVNAQGGHYGSALQAALRYEHKEVAQILVDAGARADGGKSSDSLRVQNK